MPRPLVLVVVGVAALALTEAVRAVARLLGRRSPMVAGMGRRAHRSFQFLTVALALDITLRNQGWHGRWPHVAIHLLDILAILSGGWAVATLLFVVQDAALGRQRTDTRDNRMARTVHTRVLLLRRVTVAVVALLAAAGVLGTFREARVLGASALASAVVVAAVVAFAAQTVLGNVIAGLQMAFGKALQLDDVVVVEGEWGRVEEMTLTYVVVHLWDDRRLILPNSYFTTRPFQNWTRELASLVGTVEFELDWSVPAEDMRAELGAILADAGGRWDGRVCVLQVTDAVRGLVRLRALVSAKDAPDLWELRCLVRERLVAWLREHHPHALPRLRTQVPGREGPR
jgi:small-conductance mechanosensitive channel